MLPLRATRIPGLLAHCSHGLWPLTSRSLSQTSLRQTRNRPGRSKRSPTPTKPTSQSPEEQEKENHNNDERLTVNLFEQDGDEPGAERRPSSDPNTDLAAIEGLGKDMEREIREIGKEMKDSARQTQESDTDSLIRSLFSDEHRAKVLERLKLLADQDPFIRQRKSLGDENTFASLLGSPENRNILVRPHEIKVEQDMTESSKMFLRNLNKSLDAASLSTGDEKVRKDLWQNYERSKIYVPNLLSAVPESAWTLLWNTISEQSLSNGNRNAHITILSEDMEESGRNLTQAQRFARVESLFLEDEREKALRLWELGLQSGDAGNPDYLEMGVRMYCQTANITRAEEILDVLFKLYTSWNPRIVIPLLTALLNHNTNDGSEKAFALYMRLRYLLSSDMTMEDYDHISSRFLRAGHRVFALAVFRDMMLAGGDEPSNLPYQTVVDRMGAFLSLSKDVEELNTLGLDTLTFLPRQFQNKFFYASWMKKLIGMGQMDDAAKVVELMYERKVRPDAKHVNGLIGGWLRTGDKSAHSRAEETAWSMIQARLAFVQERRREMGSHIDGPEHSVHENVEGAQLPHLATRPIPPATIETFSILVQWYLRRGMFGNVRHLRNLLVDAEISMNSYFMNHLLFAELHNRTHREVWTRFEVMSRTVTPDMESFVCLWDCMKPHVDPARNADPSGYPTPRQLFARMRVWFLDLNGQNLRDARGDVHIDLYNDIIHCFCLSRDLEGSFVALQSLKEMWGLYPDPKTIKMLAMQIARLTAPAPRDVRNKISRRKARQITASQENKDNLSHALHVLDLITRKRREELISLGIIFESLDAEQQGEENHRAILQLLYSVMMQVHGESFDGTTAITTAAAELGIEGLDVEEAMALNI